MKSFILLVSLSLFGACASQRGPAADSGAEKKQSHEEQLRQDQETHFRNQFPGARAF